MKHKNPNWPSLLGATSGDISRLDFITRYSSIPITHFESVSQHTFWVTSYAFMIHKKISRASRLDTYVLLTALSHDFPEMKTGDIVRPFKYSSKNLKKEIDLAEEKITKNFPKEIFDIIEYSNKLPKIDKDYVRVIVKAADFMSLFHFMRREAARMNLEIIPFYYRMLRDIKDESEKVPRWIVGLYREMMIEAEQVGQDCFGKHIGNSRWYREI